MALAREVLVEARARHAAGSALERSAEQRLWQQVRRVSADAEEVAFAVPSHSRPGLDHIVVKRRRGSAEEPVWALYSCSCEAHRRPACIHRAAVFQFLYRRAFGVVPIRLAGQIPAKQVPAGEWEARHAA